MSRSCSVPGCRSSSKYAKLFLAPYTDQFRWEAWRKTCPFLNKLSPKQYQNVRFCPLHFSPQDIDKNYILNHNAVPTLYLDARSLKNVTFYSKFNIHASRRKQNLPCSSSSTHSMTHSSQLHKPSTSERLFDSFSGDNLSPSTLFVPPTDQITPQHPRQTLPSAQISPPSQKVLLSDQTVTPTLTALPPTPVCRVPKSGHHTGLLNLREWAKMPRKSSMKCYIGCETDTPKAQHKEWNTASSNNRLKKTSLLKKCCICERVEHEDSSEVFLTRFPVDPKVCKQWVRNVGIAHLARKTLTYLHNNVYLCQVHFKTPQKENSSTFEAVPTEALPYPPLPDDILADFPIHSEVLLGLESDDHALDHERDDYNKDCDDQNTDGDHSRDCDDQNVTCDLDVVKSEAESEDEYNCDIGYTEDTVEAVNIPSAVDEIDSLFLSYAGTFRKLSPNLQTMLKLDIAKLFARYEMKNSTVTENEQQKGTNEMPRIAAPAPLKIKAKSAKRSSKISKPELKSNHTLKRPVASEKLVTLSAKRSKQSFTPGTHEFHKVMVCPNPVILDHQIGTNHPDIERAKTLTIDQIEANTDQNNLSESLFVLKDFSEECEQKEGDPLLEIINLNFNATQITDMKMDKL